MTQSIDDPFAATLDPPGTIVVLGTTPLGIEAALYGRCLGYEVTLLAGADVWAARPPASHGTERIGPTFQDDWFARFWLGEQTIMERWNDPLPMMPDRCLSSLAVSAIQAQRGESASVLPMTISQWINEGLQGLVESDLLRGRVFPATFVDNIDLVPIEEDEASQDAEDASEEDEDDEIPPDFLLSLSGESIPGEAGNSLRCECLIVADLPSDQIQFGFELPTDYLHQLQSAGHSDAAEEFRAGWQQISSIYAGLAGRAGLDLYRPRRV